MRAPLLYLHRTATGRIEPGLSALCAFAHY
jgi:hypothetical protein